MTDKTRILVVDDDPKLSRLIKLLLEKTGRFEVLEENRSSHAVAAARSFLPEAILLDVDMPGKDGGEVARDLAKDPVLARLPVMFCTSLVSGTEAGQHEVVRGGRTFLAKPVQPAVLIAAVDRLLSAEHAATRG